MMDKGRKIKQKGAGAKAKTAAQALSALMRLCSRSEKSTGDAIRLMARWGVPDHERASVLKQLTDSRFIDDRRFAESYVRDKVNFSGWGPYKISRGLSAKGIPREIITEVTVSLSSLDGKVNRLYSLLEKKMRRTSYKDVYDLKGKLVRYAASQGYGYEEVLEEVEKIIKEKYRDENED
ncbi:MAG: RecX family transcriptional regulator [Alistipes sp.]|nr:RecX family transcriptional regulator [Alistipes sp.]